MNDIKMIITDCVQELYDVKVELDVTRPDAAFGDFASNVALQLAKELGKNPREIATELASKIEEKESIAKVDVAGPGFVNITLSDAVLWKLANNTPDKYLDGQIKFEITETKTWINKNLFIKN